MQLMPRPPAGINGTVIYHRKKQTGLPEAALGTGDIVRAGQVAGSTPWI